MTEVSLEAMLEAFYDGFGDSGGLSWNLNCFGGVRGFNWDN